MILETRHMRAFIAIGEELSFSRAAARLHIAQPALSRTIKGLETDLGVQLLYRSTRVVRLTPAGEAFLVQSRQALNQITQAAQVARDVGQGHAGQLEIGYMDFASYGPMPEILSRFSREFPLVRLSIGRMRSDEQSVAVANRRLDVGFAFHHRFDEAVEVIPLTREPLVVLLSRDHPLAKLDAIPLSALANESFVMGSRKSWQMFLAVVEAFCAQAGYSPRVVAEVYEGAAIFQLVAAGLGLSIYPECAIKSGFPGMVIRPFVEPAPLVETYCVVRPAGNVPVVERLIHMIRDAAHPH